MTDEPVDPKAPPKKRWWRDARVIVGVCFALCEQSVSWLMFAQWSPVYRYFLYHVDFSNLWSELNTIPLIVGFLVSGNVHQPNEIACIATELIQWFVIGFVVAHLFIGARAMLKGDR
ncbi:MAG: hypothetical protein HY292_05055 [Planctomycetes bacterium]|nr:hypothetical protein [Planctomycetota bacterium]